MTSSTLAYTSYKGMFDIPVQYLPYLEAGVKLHPEVLGWLNTKRRVFAQSFFFLFAEVTTLLRTTRKGDLSEDDRNYITECCASLESVGFHASWLKYVHECIEECDAGRTVKRTLQENESKASTLKDRASILKAQLDIITKELTSVEASLVSLRGKASRFKLDDYIQS